MAYANIEKQREYQKKWIADRRAQYIAVHGGCCSKCGSSERLEFDHMDPSQKVDHKMWSWAHHRIQAELKKCQLLCASCHQEKSVSEMDYPPRQCGTNLKYQKDKCRCSECKSAHAEVNARYR